MPERRWETPSRLEASSIARGHWKGWRVRSCWEVRRWLAFKKGRDVSVLSRQSHRLKRTLVPFLGASGTPV
jgi:hypothetical protein